MLGQHSLPNISMLVVYEARTLEDNTSTMSCWGEDIPVSSSTKYTTTQAVLGWCQLAVIPMDNFHVVFLFGLSPAWFPLQVT